MELIIETIIGLIDLNGITPISILKSMQVKLIEVVFTSTMENMDYGMMYLPIIITLQDIFVKKYVR